MNKQSIVSLRVCITSSLKSPLYKLHLLLLFVSLESKLSPRAQEQAKGHESTKCLEQLGFRNPFPHQDLENY